MPIRLPPNIPRSFSSSARLRSFPSPKTRPYTTRRGIEHCKPLLFSPSIPRHTIDGACYTTSAMNASKTHTNGVSTSKPVLFFDIDNCLYPRSSKVQDHMAQLIDEYFVKHLSLQWDDAVKLHKEYYTNYGLAIEGLVRHHEIDPLEYNAQVDDALPLEDILSPNPELRELLEDVDKSKCTMWLLTNAYVNHAKRVTKLLGIDDLFDGLTFCDYGQAPLVCKPAKEMYLRAMREAGVEKMEDCYFVDDSYLNCQKAQGYGWNVAHLVEEDLPVPKTPASAHQIRHLRELRDTFPQFFKSKNA
ncbi:pyrimidine 5'-nucleotidase [Colletotrichum tamarilloi]|uniref:Pyrimidine 5'-nucleotidase n=1 Tax=Colletotrichum tamarilloi TaxID=1209934 RepID=A0ABQ9RLN2_9PEZI|nr:pyrimidine 5'-nucleotidase [Colletotrichum tamarilloi]KAK1507002.1 pyrimidine 5'-nucleotidase [Colletotrichum tamarilloi]